MPPNDTSAITKSSGLGPVPGRSVLVLLLAGALSSCHDSAAAPAVSDFSVSIHTSGGDPDTAGYSLVIDGVPLATLPPDGTVTISGVAGGRRLISLGDVDANCEVAGPHPRQVDVRPGAPTVAFAVECATTGIRVLISEVGHDPAREGYVISLNDGPGNRIVPPAALLFGRLAPGRYAVSLDPTAPNCAVNGGRTQWTGVVNRRTTDVTFDVACATISGSVQVSVTTSGLDVDWDGYGVRIDDGPDHPLDLNGSIVIPKVLQGLRTVRLGGVAGNCTVSGGAERGVQVDTGAVTSLAFEVTCVRTDVIAFTRWDDNSDDPSPAIMVTTLDGAPRALLGPGSFLGGAQAEWSPAGDRLLVSRLERYWFGYSWNSTGLHIFSTDGALLTTLTTGEDYESDWSRDGTRIVFSRRLNPFRTFLYVTSPTGAGPTAIDLPLPFITAAQPSWSHDGTRIAFRCATESTSSICLANADGSGVQQITADSLSSFAPAWSPDDTRIAFHANAAEQRIMLMNPDGTGVRTLATGVQPAWSPDGTQLVFVGRGVLTGLYRIKSDGSALVQITTNAGDQDPDWRP